MLSAGLSVRSIFVTKCEAVVLLLDLLFFLTNARMHFVFAARSARLSVNSIFFHATCACASSAAVLSNVNQ